ncbi:Hypothetical predicted protein [Mytilus galloprovincialis]|uniref:Uncharacterized protein n=1 Tax=Mytilus galloprovincialis TaxID=29158 RepID=A0A8B6FFV6_MYTGA|nr:Hypothetical predicted protein [Mytilus galloprovincialis]
MKINSSKVTTITNRTCPCAPTIHGKQWPGPPREIQAKVTQVKNETQAQFSWKPPYDASIHSLKGFLLRITTFEDVRGTFVAGSPWCFYLNFTNSSWTESPHAYESVFQFNCVKSQYPARVTLSVSSIPRPHKGWKVVKQSVDIKGTGISYFNILRFHFVQKVRTGNIGILCLEQSYPCLVSVK